MFFKQYAHAPICGACAYCFGLMVSPAAQALELPQSNAYFCTTRASCSGWASRARGRRQRSSALPEVRPSSTPCRSANGRGHRASAIVRRCRRASGSAKGVSLLGRFWT